MPSDPLATAHDFAKLDLRELPFERDLADVAEQQPSTEVRIAGNDTSNRTKLAALYLLRRPRADRRAM